MNEVETDISVVVSMGNRVYKLHEKAYDEEWLTVVEVLSEFMDDPEQYRVHDE